MGCHPGPREPPADDASTTPRSCTTRGESPSALGAGPVCRLSRSDAAMYRYAGVRRLALRVVPRRMTMATGPMQFGADNNAGPHRTTLRAQNPDQATLDVRNEPAAGLTAGDGLTVTGGPFAVRATGGQGSDLPGVGVHGTADGTGVIGEAETGVFGNSVGSGNGVWGRSPQANGVQGVSGSHDASGVYGQNDAGGWGIAGRTLNSQDIDRAGVL